MTATERTAWSYVLNEPTRILVVDDDPLLREFAGVYLSSPVAEVETAPDAAAALTMLESAPFDVALVDIEMPAADGFSLLERIRADKKLQDLPVVMLTSHDGIASIDRSFSLGANSFVTKPVNWRLLSYHIRYVLGNSRSENELRQARALAETRNTAAGKSLLALEVECRNVVKSILLRARSSAAGQEAAAATLQEIEAIAATAIERWDDFSDKASVSQARTLGPATRFPTDALEH
jgi:DNA-binding response OmpR family regulator